MGQEIRSVISGEFSGFDEGNIFRLDNGYVFQQAAYFYHYTPYRPQVRVFTKNGAIADRRGRRECTSSCYSSRSRQRGSNCFGL